MSILILVCGHLGSTLKAGKLLARQLPGEAAIVDTEQNPEVDFAAFDCVVFGTNVRMLCLNRRFKRYAARWKRAKTGKPAFCYVVAASDGNFQRYEAAARRALGPSCAAVVYAGGELDSSHAKGFAKKVIEDVKQQTLAEGRALPQIRETALTALARQIHETVC